MSGNSQVQGLSYAIEQLANAVAHMAAVVAHTPSDAAAISDVSRRALEAASKARVAVGRNP